MFEKILIGYDGSPGADRSLEAVRDLVKGGSGEVWLVAVLEHLPKYAASVGEIEEANAQGREYLRTVLSQGQERALRLGLEVQVDQVAGQPAQALVKYAREHTFDLIVLGHSGHSGIWGTFLGTTADKTMRHAHCSVLVVR